MKTQASALWFKTYNEAKAWGLENLGARFVGVKERHFKSGKTLFTAIYQAAAQ